MFDTDSIRDDDWIEDQLWIERVEPGVLWFGGGIGPVKVPKLAGDLARPGWAITLTLAKIAGEWRILEVRQRLPVAEWRSVSALTPGSRVAGERHRPPRETDIAPVGDTHRERWAVETVQ